MIQYVWVEKANNIKYQEFNLGGEWRYSFDHKENELRRKENKNYITGFYSSKITANCSLIVGENRAGKTSFLRHLSQFLSNNHEDGNRIIVIANKGDVNFLFSNFEFAYPDSLQRMDVSEITAALGFDIKVIYFSGIFNSFSRMLSDGFGGFPSEENGFYNISTDALLNKAHPDYHKDDYSNKININGLLDEFHAVEVAKQVEFFQHSYSKEIIEGLFQIELPTDLSIEILHNYLSPVSQMKKMTEKLESDKLYPKDKYDTEMLFWEFLKELERLWVHGDIDGNNREIFIYQTVAHALYQEYILHSSPMRGEIQFALANAVFGLSKLNNTLTGNIDSDFEVLCEALSNSDNIVENSLKNEYPEDEVVDFRQFRIRASMLRDSKNKIDLAFANNHIQRIRAYQWSVSLDGFSTAYQAINQLNHFEQWYKFDFRNISSGEKMIISLFSRLDHILTKECINNYSSPVYFFLDEPEVGLHPQWQRMLISGILAHIENRSTPAFNNIQIILTSNQPIIVSDFPKSDVCFLKYNARTKSTECLSDAMISEEKMATYCANISDILSHSFFLGNGSVAHFAENKVNDLIRRLRAKEHYKESEIEIIDSPLIRSYLNHLATPND